MNKHLDFLLRKNKGDKMLLAYELFFLQSGFNAKDLTYTDLGKTDEIMKVVRSMADSIQTEYEIVSGNCQDVQCSNLLSKTYNEYGLENCYIYTSDYEYCGMYSCQAGIGLENALKIAFNDRNHTCFILDTQFRYSFAIDYGDIYDSNFPNEFDIQYRTWNKRF